MQEFKIDITPKGDDLDIVVSGYINEFSKFPKLQPANTVTIDLGGVKGLNSIGTRAWCSWVKEIHHPAKIVLAKCPVIFVKSFNQVKGSYPDNAKITSFAVPYYSDANDERKDVFFVLNEHFGFPDGLRIPKITDSQGAEMEMDVVEDIYFNFLNRL